MSFLLAAGLLAGFAANTASGQSNDLKTLPYQWRNVVIGGGGFVTGVMFHPLEKGLIYARTDVGGAYRWDVAANKWIPITDWIGGMDLTGIESLAIDPSDTNRVYLAAGIYRQTRAAILRSDDQGRTFERTDVPFKMGGNENGRFNGERLVVDPHDGRILFFGSRHDGLWKSADHGATWEKAAGFPQLDATEPPPDMLRTNAWRLRLNSMPQQIGIVFVQFDPRSGLAGAPTPVIFAGVSRTGTSFFRSADAGVTWSPVPNQPLGLRPNHAVLSSDGTIFLSYGKQAGPGSMPGGAVWKFNPQSGAWTEITPLKSPDDGQSFGYGAVAVDPQNPSIIIATTFTHWRPHDEMFRSTNGGASWMPLLAGANWEYSRAPYTATRVPHWMGSVQIDPFDSNHILFTTGYGLWSSDNLTDADAGKPVSWSFVDQGLEETVPLALISPPEGAHLLSGLGDIDGFRHDDLDASPAQGTFAGVHFSNTEDLGFAAENPSVIVRSGTGRNGIHAAISTDGGKNWSALGSQPATRFGGGTISISADAKIVVWTPRLTTPEFSDNDGTSWTNCAGLAPGLRVIADAVNPLRFYAVEARTGKVLASTNGAQSFQETAAQLPVQNGARFGGGAMLSAAPGREGDLWLTLRAEGLFHSTDGGANFTKIDGVQTAGSLGIGKPASGSHFPTLFLAGQIGNVDGLFRSTDLGASWTRINDDQHQYGSISHVTGDPRIFGRVYFGTGGRGIIYGDAVE